jgi:hypothetical protein
VTRSSKPGSTFSRHWDGIAADPSLKFMVHAAGTLASFILVGVDELICR